MASTRTLFVILCLASQRSSASTCGAGPGDRRQIQVAQQECTQCNGTEAQLIFDATANDGVGWTDCYVAASTSGPLEDFELATGFTCGGALGDRRKSSVAQRLCQDCGGEGAELTYKLQYADGIGQTFCKKGNLELSQPLSENAAAVGGDQAQPAAESETAEPETASIDLLLGAVSARPIVILVGASVVVTFMFSLFTGIRSFVSIWHDRPSNGAMKALPAIRLAIASGLDLDASELAVAQV